MPRGVPKRSEWVPVPELRGPGMCNLCGKRGLKWTTYPHRPRQLYRYCSFTDKPCRGSTGRCGGPYLEEHTIDRVKKQIGFEED